MIGIITINYNSENLIKRFIEYLVKQRYKDWTLIIVNNSTSDSNINKTVKPFIGSNRIIILRANKNIGYARGNNLGFSYLIDKKIINDDDIVLFSNPDIVLEDKDILNKVIYSADSNNCGFLGPKIINNDGSMMLPHMKETNYLKCIFHIGNNGVIDKLIGYNKKIKRIKNKVNVFLLNGSCFFCRAGDFQKAGLFDINTFLYYEEELLFRKVKKFNTSIVYDPNIIVYHDHSAVVRVKYNYLEKKKILFKSELYFLESILKCSRINLLVFKFERKLEFLLIKLFSKRN